MALASASSRSSRLERLVKAIGPENLRPRQPPPETPVSVDQASEQANPEAPRASSTPPPQPAAGEAVLPPPASKWWEAVPQTSHMQLAPDCHVALPELPSLTFTPFLALTKFPYKFVDKTLLQPLASAFWDDGKIWERAWDLYCLFSPLAPTPSPIIFVPEHQFQALILEINQAFPHADISITDDFRDEGLVIDFEEFRNLPDLLPRFLGCSTSRAQYVAWTETVVMPNRSKMPAVPERTLAAFRQKIEAAVEAGKKKSKAARDRKQSENVLKRQGMAKSLLRAQQYLGLVPNLRDLPNPDISSLTLDGLLPSTTRRFPCDQDVIFIAIDVEAHERMQSIITEVGVATLDTRDLKDVAPGEAGKDWHKLIRARHFRVAEYKNHVNHEFVQGCPEKFEFGTSEIYGKDVICKVVADCFKQPFSSTATTTTTEKRNVVLLGHDISSDITYLQRIGFNVLNSSAIIDKLDTAELFRVYTRDPNARSLGSIMYEFDLMAWSLHNAGNDGVYTVWAMLAMAVKVSSERGSVEAAQRHHDQLQEKSEAATIQAKQRVKDEDEGWEVFYGPERPPVGGESKLFTTGGAPLDV